MSNTWTGTLLSPDGMQELTVVRTYEVMNKGKVIKCIKSNEELNNYGEGFFFWNDLEKKIAFFFIETGGVFQNGFVKAENNLITIEGTMTWPGQLNPQVKQSYEFKDIFEFTAEVQNIMPSVLPDKELLEATNKIFRAFRSSLQIKINSEDKAANICASIFNDIPLKDYYQLVIILSQRVKFHEEDPRRMIVYLQELETYIFCIGVADIRNFHIMGPKKLEIERGLMEANLTKTLVDIGFDTHYSTFILSLNPRIGKSHIETILDSI